VKFNPYKEIRRLEDELERLKSELRNMTAVAGCRENEQEHDTEEALQRVVKLRERAVTAAGLAAAFAEEIAKRDALLLPAEAVMGAFVWLATCQEPRTFWKERSAVDAAKIGKLFCAAHELGPCRKGWTDKLHAERDGARLVTADQAKEKG
jgi:hypothetical protein